MEKKSGSPNLRNLSVNWLTEVINGGLGSRSVDGKKVQNVLKGEQRIAILTTRPKRCVTGAGNKRPALQTIQRAGGNSREEE